MFNYAEDFFEAAHKITGFVLGEGRFEIKKIFDEFDYEYVAYEVASDARTH